MYIKSNTLLDELEYLLTNSLTPTMAQSIMSNAYSYTDDYAILLAKIVMHLCNVPFAKIELVDYLVPEIVRFAKKTMYISRISLAKYLFVSPNFTLTQLNCTAKKRTYDEMFESKAEWKPTPTKFDTYQKQQVRNLLLKVLVVANHVAIHFDQMLNDRDVDYQHEETAPFYQFDKLLTTKESDFNRAYIK